MLLEHNGADAKVLPPSIAVGKKAMSKKISGLKHQRSHSADRLITDHHPSSTPSSPSVELLHMNEVCVRVCVCACVRACASICRGGRTGPADLVT